MRCWSARRRRRGSAEAPLQALIFDSHFDQYRGVVSSVRVVNGVLAADSRLRFMQAGTVHTADEVGLRTPANEVVARLGPGETGYLIAGIKDVGEARSGETVTEDRRPAPEPLEGYSEPKPMVFSGLFPTGGDDFTNLRSALSKLRLDDAGFTYEPETSGALGFGFRCGFLGLLHMEIVRERLEREFDLSLISTAPSVQYRVTKTGGETVAVSNPSDMPPAGQCRVHLRALPEGGADHADRLHGHADGAVPVAARPPGPHGVPVPGAGRAALPAAAGRGRDRLLRPAQEPHPGLRQPRLRARRVRRRRPGEGGRAAAGGAGGRLLHRCAPRQGLRLRPGHGGPPAGVDSPPAVRGAHPGRHRRGASSPARPSRRTARTSRPSSTAATSPASASSSRSRSTARSA